MAAESQTPDDRRQLLQATLNAPLFQKAARLRSFLQYVCEKELSGQRPEINEHRIGVEVFGRAETYNPGEDSIVRSQARLLRQRLQEHFRTDGKSEPSVIVIPKGSYVPRFEPRTLAEDLLKNAVEPEALPTSEEPMRPAHLRLRFIWMAMLVAAVVAALVGLRLHRSPAVSSSPLSTFWAELLAPARTQIVVPADSTLVLVEEMLGRTVSLDQYLTRAYLATPPAAAQGLSAAELAPSQYTSMADLNFVSRLLRVPYTDTSHLQIRYARDLNITDVKDSNVILIGGPAANPWVSLFATRMNFVVDYDVQRHRNFIRNRHPQAAESATLEEEQQGSTHVVYGLLAYEPSLDRAGKALLVAGTSSAGTQAAADFISNPVLFGSFLHSVSVAGKGVPSFEVVVKAESIGGNIPRIEVVSSRVTANEN